MRDPLSEQRRIVDEFRDEWAVFFTETLLPVLTADHEDLPVKIWFDGSDVQELEVKQALRRDYGLAALSLVYVHVYLFLHTRSLLLALLGPLIALLSVPLAFVINAVVFDATTLSFANFLALFLIVGFGADVIFVYTDYWRVSEQHAATPAERLAWTYERAMKTSLTTTGTTALSFFANLVSVIRALRQFGFFMGLCVFLAWLLISLIYVPLLVLDDKYCCRCTCALYKPDPTSYKKHEPPPSCKIRCFSAWAIFLQKGRKCVVILTILCNVLFIAVSVPNLKMQEELPSLFPDNHNQKSGKEIMGQFTAMSDSFDSKFREPAREEVICAPPDFTTGPACALHWCEVQRAMLSPPLEGNGSCVCYRRNSSTALGTCDRLVKHRLVGPPLSSDWSSDIPGIVEALRGRGAGMNAQFWNSRSGVPPVLMQDWETGKVALDQVLDLTTRPTVDLGCGTEDLCFCGDRMCKLSSDEWTLLPPLQLPYNGPDLRLLSDASFNRVPRSQRIKVRVVFGLDVPSKVRLLGEADPSNNWKFVESFDPRQPWAQRNMHSFCTELPDRLRVAKSWCWMTDFRRFVRDKGLRFPCRSNEFHDLALEFIETSNLPTKGTRYIWLPGGEVRALYYSMEVDVSSKLGSAAVLEYKEEWNSYLDEWNENAIRSAKGAFHVSSAWVAAESASQLLSSTLNTMVILVTLSFLAMLLFTRSCTLSTYVVISTMSVVVGLAFFIVAVMQWEMGLIEVVAIIYFIGYALDYSLHTAHKYASREALTMVPVREEVVGKLAQVRLQRTSFSLNSIGGAVCGSAATTAGVSFFLVFCKLTIFKKLGAMCLTVTLLSVFTALGPLPAALLLCGPTQPGECRRRKKGLGNISSLTPFRWSGGGARPSSSQARE